MIREIHIAPVLNGFTCRVGCQTLVFESVEKLVEEIGKYLKAPEETEARYSKEALNAKHTLPTFGRAGTRAESLLDVVRQQAATGARGVPYDELAGMPQQVSADMAQASALGVAAGCTLKKVLGHAEVGGISRSDVLSTAGESL